MICYGSDTKLETRKEYKNRVFKRHTDKLKDSLRQIKDCSLSPTDKNQLHEQMIKLINEAK